MKKFMLAVGLLSLAGGAFAAGKPCEELKSEIAAKLDAKGVSGYSLEIVDKGAAAGGKPWPFLFVGIRGGAETAPERYRPRPARGRRRGVGAAGNPA